MKGLAVCPLTGHRIQDNRLVRDQINLKTGRKMFQQIGKKTIRVVYYLL